MVYVSFRDTEEGNGVARGCDDKLFFLNKKRVVCINIGTKGFPLIYKNLQFN